MADPRFYDVEGPFTLRELARICDGEVLRAEDLDRLVRDVAPLGTAGPHDISFLDNNRYLDAFRKTRAGACIVGADRADGAPVETGLLIADNPYRAYALVAQAFYPRPRVDNPSSSNTAVDPTATVGEGTVIGPGAVVGAAAEIGCRATIGANAVVGPGVVIGDDSWIGSCVSLAYCLIGARVRIFAGARIGEDGFGFSPDGHAPLNIPQLGRVIIKDDVEIGANTTIDRGAGPDTMIGEGCRIDNLVQIGHNVEVGRGCIIIAQVGISGSVRLEDYSIVAGQAGIAGHLTIGKGARIAAQTGVMRDVPAGVSVAGTPATPAKQWFRQVATVERLARKKGQ